MNLTGVPSDVQASVTLLFLLATFGFWGFRRGFVRELVVFVGLIFLRMNQGRLLFSLFNWLRFAFRFVELLVKDRGKGSATVLDAAMNVYKATFATGVPEKSLETTTILFSSFLITIVLIYLVSGLFKRKLPGFGALLGALNGYLLGYWLLPALPHALPEPKVIGGGVSTAANSQAGQLLAQGLSKTQSVFGVDPFYLIAIICIGVIIWAVREIG